MRSSICLLLAVGLVAACSATNNHLFTTGAGGSGNGGGGVGASQTTGVGFGGFTGSGGGPAEGSCSADLQSVVDSKGNVLKMCPPAEGCAGGQCVDACT